MSDIDLRGLWFFLVALVTGALGVAGLLVQTPILFVAFRGLPRGIRFRSACAGPGLCAALGGGLALAADSIPFHARRAADDFALALPLVAVALWVILTFRGVRALRAERARRPAT